MSIPLIRWVFYRDGHALTCEVDARGERSFEVSMVPHWNGSAATVERFAGVVAAMERHASIARALRGQGWRVVDHAPVGEPVAA